MTNNEIIYKLAKDSRLYPPALISTLKEDGALPPLHTRSVWNKLGYTPRTNEIGFKAKIWLRQGDDFHLCPATFYDITQVVPL